MHHIFDQHSQPVPCVRFANNDKNFMACCCMDGTISVCQVLPEGAVLKTLQGHKKGVTDLQWSAANEFILSTSLDKTIRIWDMKTGACLRTIVDIAEVLCCLFHPENNNIFVVGNRKNEVKSYNLSTGKSILNGMTQIGAPVTAMTFNQGGQYLYAGNDRVNSSFTARFTLTGGVRSIDVGGVFLFLFFLIAGRGVYTSVFQADGGDPADPEVPGLKKGNQLPFFLVVVQPGHERPVAPGLEQGEHDQALPDRRQLQVYPAEHLSRPKPLLGCQEHLLSPNVLPGRGLHW